MNQNFSNMKLIGLYLSVKVLPQVENEFCEYLVKKLIGFSSSNPISALGVRKNINRSFYFGKSVSDKCESFSRKLQEMYFKTLQMYMVELNHSDNEVCEFLHFNYNSNGEISHGDGQMLLLLSSDLPTELTSTLGAMLKYVANRTINCVIDQFPNDELFLETFSKKLVPSIARLIKDPGLIEIFK